MQSLNDLKAYLIKTFCHEKVYLFGSRAKGTQTPFSDIDIVIEGRSDLTQRLTLARETIENSNLPNKVDLIDLSTAPYLKEIIQQEGVRWH